MKEQFVLDASALLCILFDERGEERVNQIIDRSRIHAVNLAEVIGHLIRSGMPGEKVTAALGELYLEVDDKFGTSEAEFCGALLGTSGDLGLSLGDCVCLTMAARLGAVAVTADRRWKELDGRVVKDATIRVELIR